MASSRYLTAQEAANLLRIKEATLYAYVSRGLIRSEGVGKTPRQHLYLAEDVQKLVERKAHRRDPSRVARDALHWGTPLLESALTLITDNTLYYRGHNALQLAREQPLEAVAALFWTGDLGRAMPLFDTPVVFTDVVRTVTGLQLPPMSSLQVALSLAAAEDLSAYDLHPDALLRTGARMLWLLAAVAARQEACQATIARTLSQAWQVGHDTLLNAALILCADHELNVSSFTARVVASAEANPYAVVLAGLAALGGFKHGGHTERAAAFLREIGEPSRARLVIAERLRRGEGLPAFGHQLYPDGDPRATTLLALLAEHYPDAPALILAETVRREAAAVRGEAPNIDFALATLELTLQLPYGTGLTLFAIGRTVGWLGHAFEQYHSKRLIRPRARYTGNAPHMK